MANRAILTTTRNSSHIWKYFIQSFKDYCSEEYDLYVWDNGSRAGDREYLRTYQKDGTIKWLSGDDKNMLFTHSTNTLLGVANSMGHYEQFVIANPDIMFTEGWDEDVSRNDGIMGFVLVKPNGILEHAGGFGGGDHLGRGEEDEGQFAGVREVDWVTFGAVAISRGAFERLGLLDQNYPHFGSDREYCKAAKEAGIPVRCSGKRLVHFYGWACRPYEWRDIPEDIWKQHVAERKSSGVYFPEDQNRIPRIDHQFKVTPA